MRVPAPPDPLHGGRAEPRRLGHRAATPVGRSRRRVVQRGIQHHLDGRCEGGEFATPSGVNIISPSSANHVRHPTMLLGARLTCSAIAEFGSPSAASNNACARIARRAGRAQTWPGPPVPLHVPSTGSALGSPVSPHQPIPDPRYLPDSRLAGPDVHGRGFHESPTVDRFSADSYSLCQYAAGFACQPGGQGRLVGRAAHGRRGSDDDGERAG